MTLFDVLCGIGLVIGLELVVGLALWIKYLTCLIQEYNGFCECDNFEEEDICVCEHPDESCCRVDIPVKKFKKTKKGK